MPLYAGYRRMLDSKVADISSTGSELGQAGAVTAALFLQEFVKVSGIQFDRLRQMLCS